MKNMLKKAGILWLMIVCGAWLVFTNWATPTLIPVSPDNNSPEHVLHLHSLFLSSGNIDTGASWIKANGSNLDILNGLIIQTWASRDSSKGRLIVVWWWENNTVKGENSWIWWWYENQFYVDSDNSAIWWWYNNKIRWNNAVVAWWQSNTANESWVVVGWQSNTASDWVTLWWYKNNANWKNSLVMWQNAKWAKWSFVWNDSATWINAPQNSARMDTNNGVLIWTFNPIKGVALVVSWAIKLGGDLWSQSLTWEMKVDNGCINVYDGKNWHSLGGKCWEILGGSGCQFGKTFLQDGEVRTCYTKSVSPNCNSTQIKTTVACNNWNLDKTCFPYCYNVGNPYDPEYYN